MIPVISIVQKQFASFQSLISKEEELVAIVSDMAVSTNSNIPQFSLPK